MHTHQLRVSLETIGHEHSKDNSGRGAHDDHESRVDGDGRADDKQNC